LWHIVTYCDILWHIVTYCDILWHIVTYYDISRHIVTYCENRRRRQSIWPGDDFPLNLRLGTHKGFEATNDTILWACRNGHGCWLYCVCGRDCVSVHTHTHTDTNTDRMTNLSTYVVTSKNMLRLCICDCLCVYICFCVCMLAHVHTSNTHFLYACMNVQLVLKHAWKVCFQI